MEFSLSKTQANRLEFVAETGSTNSDLTRMASGPDADAWPDFSVLVAGFQSAGRGRSGREWIAPAGTSLFASLLLRPNVRLERLSWLPLMAGLALHQATSNLLPNAQVGIKWPNDLLIGSLKAAGVLSELLPDQKGVVVGMGVNLSQNAEELPIETATSLKLSGAEGIRPDEFLSAVLANFRPLYDSWVSSAGDAQASGLQAQVVASCSTIGREVRAVMPDGNDLIGNAIGLDATGRILIQPAGLIGSDEIFALNAADIVHLRH